MGLDLNKVLVNSPILSGEKMKKRDDSGRLLTEEDELTSLEKKAIKSVHWTEMGYRVFMSKGMSKATTEFSIEAVRRLWRRYLKLLKSPTA
jgi:hypothetical protein